MKLHSHEAGHWLYWLMKEQNFEDYSINEQNCPNKCACLSSSSPGALAEAFAESHIFEFVYSRHTGYGDYEFEQGGEVDTICESPIQKDPNNDNCPNCKNRCVSCNASSLYVKACSSHDGQIGNMICFDNAKPQEGDYMVSCTDSKNSPCAKLTIPTQTSLLRDIYDSVNSFRLDGGMDKVILPINQMFHCLKGHVSDVTVTNSNSPIYIENFLDKIEDENICGVNLSQLKEYYGVPDEQDNF